MNLTKFSLLPKETQVAIEKAIGPYPVKDPLIKKNKWCVEAERFLEMRDRSVRLAKHVLDPKTGDPSAVKSFFYVLRRLVGEDTVKFRKTASA